MNRSLLPFLVLPVAVVCAAASCEPTPSTDEGTPTVYLLHFEAGPNGTQGAQRQVQPGGTVGLSGAYLLSNKAEIRIYGEEDPGISTLTVTGSGHGTCSTLPDPNGQFWTSPTGGMSFSVPTQTEKAPSGQVQDFLAVHLDDVVKNLSCGTKTYQGMPGPREFLFDRGTITLHATADNCCGHSGEGDFTLKVS